jgi:hypothetical protein
MVNLFVSCGLPAESFLGFYWQKKESKNIYLSKLKSIFWRGMYESSRLYKAEFAVGNFGETSTRAKRGAGFD